MQTVKTCADLVSLGGKIKSVIFFGADHRKQSLLHDWIGFFQIQQTDEWVGLNQQSLMEFAGNSTGFLNKDTGTAISLSTWSLLPISSQAKHTRIFLIYDFRYILEDARRNCNYRLSDRQKLLKETVQLGYHYPQLFTLEQHNIRHFMAHLLLDEFSMRFFSSTIIWHCGLCDGSCELCTANKHLSRKLAGLSCLIDA